MGGLNSMSYSHAGRKKVRAVEVVGTGSPQLPENLSDDVKTAFKTLVKLTKGVTFEQDSRTILEAAELIARQDKFREALQLTPLDEKLNRVSLAIGRQLALLLGKLGLNPRDRQPLLAPDVETEPDDPITTLLRKREGGVPSRKRDQPVSKRRFFK